MLPVTVIGGYLGAGKTTLVNHLLRHADGTKLAVLVNEFGSLPIDADLIEAQDETMISIAGGCVCCSYGNDLIQAMLDLSALEQTPDHILIEASGVAMPGAIAASVSIMDGLAVDGIVVLADAETIRTQVSDAYIGDTIERQLSDADLVLLNKCDLVAQDGVGALQNWLGEKAPNATVVKAHHAKVPNPVVLQRHESHDGEALTDFHPHADAFQSRIIGFDTDCDVEAVARFLAAPEQNLVRAKGFVPTPEGMRAIHTVGRRWAVSDAPAGATPGVVIIAQKWGADLSAVASRWVAAE
ncbi:GTP-binding protein [Sulfitobacter sp. S190]|uniref:CobW family GTP-binding protein n=1 Tax=Sulfitobacter sp. S190 TaxID=2867022 RepID=UPI0021A7B3C0|nr:GTP-binding protein [Sulfitobacter sp. S190]UWR22024.1 GTP-binding protein [Sulfitobacter sp. S190]